MVVKHKNILLLHRFKIDVIVEDNTNQHNFLMIGRQAEKILRVSCHTLVMQEGYEDPFVAPPILANLVGQSKSFRVSFGNQNNNFEEIDFIVHGLLEDKPLSEPTIPSIKPQTPASTVAKIIINHVTPAPLMPSQPLDQQPRSIATARTSKRTLFLDQPNTSVSKKPHTEQTTTTNVAIISPEFHNLVVSKIELADKVPIATLRTKTQPKKIKKLSKMFGPRKSEQPCPQ
ncbi:uncharacterized protein LOC126592125 [Malus sylvestris]|uniref:uncharacterized protein LOC126592123 n=1 Tax=Malus sylvestris TaxID=3752 RepID=UPI0021AC2472|nr:uncharacterized protein LOC126592123 [Malus sylvestris]XP_050113836.1 uncharacterized protein LOC126592125 [Malus sylvestris]